MAFQRPFLISLRREDARTPWGFRLVGGTDIQPQHIVQQILEDSQAEKAGLHDGDEVIQVGRVNVQGVGHKDVQEVIEHCRNRVEMFIIREDLFRSRKENEPPVVKAVVHSPYNSPFQLYSTENVADTLASQTEVLTEGCDSPRILNHLGPKSPPVATQSDVLRYLKEEERGFYDSGGVPTPPPRKKVPPPTAPKPTVRFQDPPASTINITDYGTITDNRYQQQQYQLQQQRYEDNYKTWEEPNIRPETSQTRVPLQSRENYAVSYNQAKRATTAQYQQNPPQTRPEYHSQGSFTSQQTISVQPKQYQQQEYQQRVTTHQEQVIRQQYQQEQVNRQKYQPEQLNRQQYQQIEQHRQQEQLRQEQIRQEQIRQEQIRQEQIRQEQIRQEQIRQEQIRQEQIRQHEQLRQQEIRRQQLFQQETQRQLAQTEEVQQGRRKIPTVRSNPTYADHVGSMTKTGDRVPLTSTSRMTPDSPVMGSPNVTRRGGGVPVWPPKNSSVRDLPRTGFSPNLAHEQGSKKFVWPPPNEIMESLARPPTPTGGAANAWHPNESSSARSLPFIQSPPPTRRNKDIAWPPAHTLQRGSPKHSPKVIRRKTGSFDDYIYQHASVNVPPTYRTPPGTQHVEIVYEDDF